MTSRGQIWKCNVCGNIIEVLHDGADSLVCCGQPMNLMDEKSVEEGNDSAQSTPNAAGAKHKPVIDGKIVKVGSVAHPMEDAHYIEWIEAASESGMAPCKKFLNSSDAPEVEFPFVVTSARAYCNVHGLWKS